MAPGLLDHVGDLVSEQLEAGVGVGAQRTGPEEHVGPGRERVGVQRRGEVVGRVALMQAHALEVGAVGPLQRGAQAVGDGDAATKLGADHAYAWVDGVRKGCAHRRSFLEGEEAEARDRSGEGDDDPRRGPTPPPSPEDSMVEKGSPPG